MGLMGTNGPEVVGEILVVQYIVEEIREHNINIETPVLNSVQVYSLSYILAILPDDLLTNVRLRRPRLGTARALWGPKKRIYFRLK